MPHERRNLWLGALIVLASVAAAVGLTLYLEGNREPRYRSIARLLITPNPAFYEGRDLLAGLETLERTSIQATYEEVFNSSRIRTTAMAALPVDEPGLDRFEVEAVALPSADVLRVAAQGPSARETATLANAVVEQGLAYLRDRYPMYRVEVLDAAVPAAEPFAPDLPRSLVPAVVVGAGFGLAVALLVTGSTLASRWATELVPQDSPGRAPIHVPANAWASFERDMERRR